MTTLTMPLSSAQAPAFRDVLRSEWTKLRSLGSTWWSLLVVLVGTVGVGALICAAAVARWNQLTPADRAHFDPTLRSLTGVFVGQLAVGVLGVLAITSEYATGMIRSTLAAVPRRRSVLAAKGVVLAATTLVISSVGCVLAFLTGQAILSSRGIGVSLFQPGELRAVLGGGLYLTVLALLAFGLGAMFRHTAGAISAFVGLVLVAPVIVSPLPSPWGRDLSKFLPANAGQAIFDLHPTAGSLAPWTGFVVLCLWALAALVGAVWLITKRDA